MLPNHSSFTSANEQYVSNFGEKGSLAVPPAKKLVIVTCMDARIDPAASLGIKEGDAHVIRNAGGLAKDSVRSIIISQQLLGTNEIAVFHHTGCGMLLFTNEVLREKLKQAYPKSSADIQSIDFGPFTEVEGAVKSDVEFLKNHPLVLSDSVITGWVYEVETGKVRQLV